ncbi:hypothetical protein C8J57DRAFT_1503308 [Mycena rebaudengoi]|nr:hypothetical protein C8J57DRAFT_1503308 [Mycena rebaudengoi]
MDDRLLKSGSAVGRMPFELWLQIIRIYLASYHGMYRLFVSHRDIAARVCFAWRSVVVGSREFWCQIQLNSVEPIPHLAKCIQRSMRLPIFARILLQDDSSRSFLQGRRALCKHHNPLSIIKAFKPAVVNVTLFDITVLEALKNALDSNQCIQLISLGLVFQNEIGFYLARGMDAPVIRFPHGLVCLLSIRTQQLRVDWSESSGFGHLWTIVLQDMGSAFGMRRSDFDTLFAGAPRIQ